MAESPIRVRIAYGADEHAFWRGEIHAEGASLRDLRALPIDPDPYGGAWQTGETVKIAHAVPATRGACDITISRREGATLSIRIGSSDGSERVDATFRVEDLSRGEPLVEQGPGGVRVFAQRLTDDRLRIVHERENLVFAPGERFPFQVVVDPPNVGAGSSYEFAAELRDATDRVVWSEPLRRVDAPVDGLASRALDLPAPNEEGVYRMSLRVTRPAGFTSRFRVGGSSDPLVRRDFDIVVFDQNASPRRLGEWIEAYAFDPASPTWRDRLPAWTGWRRLPWVNAGFFGSLNGRGAPPVRDGYVEIPPTGDRDIVNWQAFPLATPASGEPVLVEVQLPEDAPEQVGITLMDANADGSLSPIADGVVTETPRWGRSSSPRVASIVCWPRTEGPLLIVHNASVEHPARFGRIRVSHPLRTVAQRPEPKNPVLLDFDDPSFGRFVGLGAESGSGSLAETLTAARRLADLVDSAGANGAVLTVNRGGAALDGGPALGRSARFDAGVWRSGADDLPRVTGLELVLRVFERRGLKLTPAIDLDVELPGFIRKSVVADNANATPPVGTPLDPRFRKELLSAIEELRDRTSGYEAVSGTAIRIDGDSPFLAEADAEEFDTTTVDRFLATQGLRWPEGVPRGPKEHVAALRDKLGDEWSAWRRSQIVQFYDTLTQAIGSPPLMLSRKLHTAPRFAAAATPRLTREGLPPDTPRNLGVEGAPLLLPQALALRRPLHRHASQTRASELARDTHPATRVQRTESVTRGSVLRDGTRWFGRETVVRSVEAPAGAESAALARALAAESGAAFIDGGPASLGWLDRRSVRLRRQLGQRGDDNVTSRTISEGAVFFTIPSGDDTLLYAVSLCPWTVHGEATVKTDGRCLATPLDADRGSGTLWEQNEGTVSIELQPYEARGWRLLGAKATVDYAYAAPEESALSEVADRLDDFQRRDRTTRRPAALITNPSFESIDNYGAVTGWRVVSGVGTITGNTSRDGQSCLFLESEVDAAEVVSSPFPAPETGQLGVTFAAQPSDLAPDAILRITLEQDDGNYRVETTVPADSLESEGETGWRELIFAVDDLPLGDGPPLRLKLSLEGGGSLLIDDVRTETLKLTLPSYADDLRAEKLALVRLQRDAELAFEEQRLSDCREILDSYWARFVTEYFPRKTKPPPSPTPPANEIFEESTPSSEEETEVADRWRRYLPTFLR